MNAPWHRTHRKPAQASTARRRQWHLEHDVYCGCRPMPAAIRKELLRELREERASRLRA